MFFFKVENFFGEINKCMRKNNMILQEVNRRMKYVTTFQDT